MKLSRSLSVIVLTVTRNDVISTMRSIRPIQAVSGACGDQARDAAVHANDAERRQLQADIEDLRRREQQAEQALSRAAEPSS